MKQSIFLQPLLVLALISGLIVTSCKKKKENLPGNTTSIAEVKTTGNVNTVPLDFGGGSQAATLFTLQSTNSAAVTVKMSTDNGPVTAAKLMPLPASSYTALPLQQSVPANGSLPVQLTINKAGLTADTTYGLYFKLDEVSAGTIVADAKTLLVKITLRNRWDGRYKVTGTLVDVTNATYTFTEQEVNLITTGTNQAKIIPPQLGIAGMLIKIGGSLSYYSNFGPVLNFSNDNKVTSVTNIYGQPAPNGRSAEIDPSGANSWNPSDKTMNLKFWMNEPAVATPHRSSFTTTWTYLGER